MPPNPVGLFLVCALALFAGRACAEDAAPTGADAHADGAQPSATAEKAEAQPPDDGDEILENGKTRRETVAMYAYCQSDNCYELLGVKTTSGSIAIKRAYRRLASEWHPDKNPNPNAKAIFQKYANAYEVLSNTEMRKNYDYLLAHPYEFPMHFLRFNSYRYAPKSDVRVVFLLIILGISIVQYFFRKQRRANVIDAIKGTRGFQERLKVITAQTAAASSKSLSKPRSGSAKDTTSSKSKVASKSKAGQEETAKAELKKAAELQLLEEMANELPPAPKLQDTLAYIIFTLPLTSTYWVQSTSNWVVKFRILGQEYGPAERELLTRTALGLAEMAWERLPEEEREELIERELWLAENKAAYEEELAEGEDRPTARTSKEKRAIRQKKRPVEAPPMD